MRFPDWEVAKGEHSLVLGPSGGGKTTFLHLLSGLLKPQQGEVIVEGECISEMKPARLDRFRGQHIGFVFQKPHLVKGLSVYENILLAPFFGNKKEQVPSIEEVLSDLGISQIRNKKVHEISQGQAQRVAIARAVINQPDVVFGDEPTASLDDESCVAVIELLKAQSNRCQATLVIATHDRRVKSEFNHQLVL